MFAQSQALSSRTRAGTGVSGSNSFLNHSMSPSMKLSQNDINATSFNGLSMFSSGSSLHASIANVLIIENFVAARASVQSLLLQIMSNCKIVLNGSEIYLPKPFMVIALVPDTIGTSSSTNVTPLSMLLNEDLVRQFCVCTTLPKYVPLQFGFSDELVIPKSVSTILFLYITNAFKVTHSLFEMVNRNMHSSKHNQKRSTSTATSNNTSKTFSNTQDVIPSSTKVQAQIPMTSF